MKIKVGDWVTSYSSGIWRVYRLLDNVVQAVSTAKGTDSISLVCSSRLLSSSYKPLFKSECCAPGFVRKLEPGELSKLNGYINENPKIFEKFDKRPPQTVKAYTDVFFTQPPNKTSEDIANLFDQNLKIKARDITKVMNKINLIWQGKPSWRIEFVCVDYESVDGELIYAFNKVLEF